MQTAMVRSVRQHHTVGSVLSENGVMHVKAHLIIIDGGEQKGQEGMNYGT